MSGKANVAEFSGFFRFQHGFKSASGGEDAVWVGIANHLMKLQEVDVIGLQALQ